MVRDPIVVHAEDVAEPWLAHAERQDFDAMAVVDPGGRLLSVVTKHASCDCFAGPT
jgi:hypothetical protein